MSALWPYPEDVLHVLAPHLPYRTLGRLTRVNSLFRSILTPHLYHTMLIDDKHRGLRLRRALHSPGAVHTRILYVDAGHSCDECLVVRAPALPNLKRVVLSFDRGISLDKDSIWPDDPCRTLSRLRPQTVVMRVRNHLVDDVYPYLQHHMPRALFQHAEIVVSTLITDHPYLSQPMSGWDRHPTQILLPGPNIDAAWRLLDTLAVQVASKHYLTLVGLEAYPRSVGTLPGSKREETSLSQNETPDERDVEEAQEGEEAFRAEVARHIRIQAPLEMKPDEVERMVAESLDGLRLVTLAKYLRQREWVGEVPPNVAAAVRRQ